MLFLYFFVTMRTFLAYNCLYFRKLSGAVIALCCHHRCAWKPYVGKNFFKQCGLVARDYQVISSMSSWATCDWKGWSYQRKVAGQSLKSADNSIENTIDNEKVESTVETENNKLESKSEDADRTGGDKKEGNLDETPEGSKGYITKKDKISGFDEEEEHVQDEDITNTR